MLRNKSSRNGNGAGPLHFDHFSLSVLGYPTLDIHFLAWRRRSTSPAVRLGGLSGPGRPPGGSAGGLPPATPFLLFWPK